ncbi:unnamed protein product, partial [Heterotrigona itama]
STEQHWQRICAETSTKGNVESPPFCVAEGWSRGDAAQHHTPVSFALRESNAAIGSTSSIQRAMQILKDRSRIQEIPASCEEEKKEMEQQISISHQ